MEFNRNIFKHILFIIESIDMARTTLKNQKEDEKQVISELIRNGNALLDDIAEKLGCSRQKIWRIIKRLEETKVIWGYTAVVDPEKTKTRKYFVFVKWNIQPMGKDTLDILSKGNIDSGFSIDSSYFIHGMFDWLFVISVEDVVELKKFCSSLHATFPKRISEIQTVEVLVPVRVHSIDNPSSEKIFDCYSLD